MDFRIHKDTILGLLMFLLLFNDIGDDIDSSMKLLANDCLLLRKILFGKDTTKLQSDLNSSA